MDIESVRNYCLSLPQTQEDLKWGNNLCFTLASKIYCVVDTDGLYKVTFKCREEDYTFLVERASITPAPYFAKNKWVSISESSALSIKEWETFIRNSYELVKSKLSKKMQVQIDAVKK